MLCRSNESGTHVVDDGAEAICKGKGGVSPEREPEEAKSGRTSDAKDRRRAHLRANRVLDPLVRCLVEARRRLVEEKDARRRELQDAPREGEELPLTGTWHTETSDKVQPIGRIQS